MNKIQTISIISTCIIAIFIILSPSSFPIPQPISFSNDQSFDILATNLENPTAMDLVDNKIYITEKNGTIKIITLNNLHNITFFTIDVANIFGGGLLGLTTHPHFHANHFIYVYLTYEENSLLWNKVIRITESHNSVMQITPIIDKIPGSVFTNGGILKFGPDDKLYVGTGSSNNSSSQDITSLSGKILRLNDDGSIPSDNPFVNSPVFSYGHRDPHGMAWDSSGHLFITESGELYDELNLIVAGKNYGWPNQECLGNDLSLPALACYDPTIEPGGIIITEDHKHNSYMFMASLRASNLYKLQINNDDISSQKIIFTGLGRIKDIDIDEYNRLYLLTSNTDGKGFPSDNDDKLIRIIK